MRERFSGALRAVSLAALLLLVTPLLAACEAGQSPLPSASARASGSPSPSPSGPPVPDPVFLPGGSADDNLAYFDFVNSKLLEANPTPGGRAIIDNLVAAGFDRAAMQVTPDETSIGLDADSVQFSVRFGERCLIGQSSESGYVGTVGPAVAGTNCLVGTTRPIDW